MNRFLFLIILLFTSQLTLGQSCVYENLSKTFYFKTFSDKIIVKDNYLNKVEILIYCKATNEILQRVEIKKKSGYYKNGLDKYGDWLKPTFKNCHSRTYFNSEVDSLKIPYNNDHGDFIIADFNFDSKEDFAIKTELWGGPLTGKWPIYEYFLQTENGLFVCDKFLSDEVKYFPLMLNKNKRTLKTFASEALFVYSEIVYYLNPTTLKWQKIQSWDSFYEE